MKKYILILCTLFTSYLSAQEDISSLKLPEGLVLKDLNGKDFAVKDMAKGSSPFILDFWATWCGPCILKYDSMKPVANNWKKDTGVEIYIVSIDKEDNLAEIKQMIKEKGWPFKVLLDPEKKLFGAFNQGKESIPQTFFFEPDGNLRFKTTGMTIKMKTTTAADKDLRADLTDYYEKIQQLIR